MRVLWHFVRWRLGITGPETQVSADERACLAGHARGRTRLVEIGVWHGATTRLLRSVMDPDGTLHAVDPFPPGRLGRSLQAVIAHREVERVPRGTVEWHRTTGAEAGRAYAAAGRPPVDFLFIDGNHSWDGIRGDWEAWHEQIAPGGIVALHDSRPTAHRPIADAGSVRYTNDVIRPNARFEVVDEVESLTVLRRRSP